MRSNKQLSLKKRYNKVFILLFFLIFIIIPFSTILSAQDEDNYLIVTSEKNVVDANEIFSVVVKDKDENPVEDAEVYIQSVYDSTESTNKDGRVWLNAPGDRTDIKIIAQKEGYTEGSTIIKINVPLSFWELIQSPDAQIIIAVILLVSAILFVMIRKRKSINIRAKEISNEQNIVKHGSHGAVLSEPSSDMYKNQTESA